MKLTDKEIIQKQKEEIKELKSLLIKTATHFDEALDLMQGTAESADDASYKNRYDFFRRFINKHFN